MTEAATKRVGQVIDGKFRLGEFVGGDEGSSVFLTDYAAPGVRKAAIKLVPADSAEAAGLLARWRHAAKLSHPHMIRLLDMGRGELDGAAVLYVVMEYAEENLSGVIARRPLAPEEARAILGPVVDALAYVHAKGFVHCRIKPANIMAENDLLKISSDGLCRIGEFSGSVGKPGAYDPPEAAGGRISPAGDVWSLGMTLCEALTQRLPVWERTNQAEPALPSNLPPEFLDLARHCLRRDPQLRWSVADIAARLLPNAPAPPKQTSARRTIFLGTAALRRHGCAHRAGVTGDFGCGANFPSPLADRADPYSCRGRSASSTKSSTRTPATNAANSSAEAGEEARADRSCSCARREASATSSAATRVAACDKLFGAAQHEERCREQSMLRRPAGSTQGRSAAAANGDSIEQRRGARKSCSAISAGRFAKIARHNSRQSQSQRESPRGRIWSRDGSSIRCSGAQPIFRRPHTRSREALAICARKNGWPQRAERMGAAIRD